MTLTTIQRNWIIDTYTEAMVTEDEREFLADAMDNRSDSELVSICDGDLDESWRQEFTDQFGQTLS